MIGQGFLVQNGTTETRERTVTLGAGRRHRHAQLVLGARDERGHGCWYWGKHIIFDGGRAQTGATMLYRPTDKKNKMLLKQ